MPPMSKSLVVVLKYAVFGSLWILFSDYAVELIAKTGIPAELLQSLKGLAFIVVTALLLYYLLQKEIFNVDRAEVLREQSESRYRTTFLNAPDPLWEQDFSAVKEKLDSLALTTAEEFDLYLRDHPGFVFDCFAKIGIRDINQAGLRFLDAREKADVNRCFGAFVENRSFESLIRELVAVGTGEAELEVQVPVYGGNGESREYVVRWSVLSGHEQTYSRVYTTVSDVTALVRARKKLEESEYKYRTLIENATDAVIVVQGERIRFANPAAERLYEKSLQSIDDKHFGLLVHPDDRDMVLDNYRKRLVGTGSPEKYAFRMLSGTDKIRWVEVRVAMIPWKGETASLLVVSDITDRKQAEEALRESEKRYRDLMENVGEGVVVIQDGLLVFHNREFLRISGCNEDELREARLDTFIHEEDKRDLELLFERLRTGEKAPRDTLFRLMARDGNTRWIRMNAVVFDWNEKKAALAIMNDITRQKELQDRNAEMAARVRQTQKLEAIGTLAGGIAHDFNNLLSVILGFTRLSIDSLPEDSPLLEDLETVVAAGERAGDLVNQILTFSHRQEEETQPLQIYLVIKEAVKMLRSSIPAHIEIDHDIQSKKYVEIDPSQLHSVVMNLCTNAYQALPDSGGRIQIDLADCEVDRLQAESHPDLEPGKYVCLRVADNGMGMTPDVLERIFEPYFSTKGTERGTGLGLSVVHGIVSGANGAVKVQSKPGQGTCFEVFFPVHEERSAPPSEKAAEAAEGGGNERILVVDDEEAVLRLMDKTLEKQGYRVAPFSTPEEALTAFRQNPLLYDMIITDLSMPVMTGKELAREAFRIRNDIPVILCTGLAEDRDDVASKEWHINKTITKPFNRETLLKAVRHVLEREERNVT